MQTRGFMVWAQGAGACSAVDTLECEEQGSRDVLQSPASKKQKPRGMHERLVHPKREGSSHCSSDAEDEGAIKSFKYRLPQQSFLTQKVWTSTKTRRDFERPRKLTQPIVKWSKGHVHINQVIMHLTYVHVGAAQRRREAAE